MTPREVEDQGRDSARDVCGGHERALGSGVTVERNFSLCDHLPIQVYRSRGRAHIVGAGRENARRERQLVIFRPRASAALETTSSRAASHARVPDHHGDPCPPRSRPRLARARSRPRADARARLAAPPHACLRGRRSRSRVVARLRDPPAASFSVVVFGANGKTGRRCVARAAAAGARVVACTRAGDFNAAGLENASLVERARVTSPRRATRRCVRSSATATRRSRGVGVSGRGLAPGGGQGRGSLNWPPRVTERSRGSSSCPAARSANPCRRCTCSSTFEGAARQNRGRCCGARLCTSRATAATTSSCGPAA